jgi:hypothetical protein
VKPLKSDVGFIIQDVMNRDSSGKNQQFFTLPNSNKFVKNITLFENVNAQQYSKILKILFSIYI